jgi:type IX secretion system PorP/SprF family membrane protein
LRVCAQQDPLFTHYMFTALYYNPAFAGTEGVTKLTAIHHSQWLGYESSYGGGGAPMTQMISFTTPIHRIKSGFGAYVANDNLGPQNNQEIQLSYAYHLGIKESKLSFGIRVGAYSQALDFDKYRYIHPDDPKLMGKQGKTSQIRPDMAAGVYYRSEKYYMGAGFNHLLKSEFDFGVGQRGALVNHMVVSGGYYYDASFDLKLNPSFLVRTDFNSYQFDINLMAILKDTMWAGLSFRQSEAASLLLGYSLLKSKALKLGYSIDYVLKNQQAKQATSHELMISYELPVSLKSGKMPVRTPRYRH